MAAKRQGGHQRQVKGFRPGKEPPQLRKKRAKAQLGANASWAQKQAVDVIAGRSPEEVRRMVHRWSVGLMAGGVLVALVGIFLYAWSVPAGIAVHVVSAVCLFLGFRLRSSGQGLVDMADSL
jgi:hypothetical protein